MDNSSGPGFSGIQYCLLSAKQQEEKIRKLLSLSKYALPLSIAGAMFCLGMALTSARWWEILLWIVMMGLFGYQLFMIGKLKIE